MRNDLVLCWKDNGLIRPSHFRLREFESESGLVVVSPSLIEALEALRKNLCQKYSTEVEIVITSGTRTESDNILLAKRLGWIDEGGVVARDSRHLPKYGGIAADLYARYRQLGSWVVVAQNVVGSACRQYFEYVKDDYDDGHVHADVRGR